MAFSETRLELGIPSSSGGYTFRTKSIKVASEFEQRDSMRLQLLPSGGKRIQPLFQGDIGKVLLDERQVAYVQAFFNARKGRAIGFRYKYWADYEVTHEDKKVKCLHYGFPALDSLVSSQGVANPIPMTTASTSTPSSSGGLQLQKKYTSFGVESYKNIYKPVEGTVKIYVDGNLQSGAAVDYTTGRVTGVSGNITWDGEFDLPVRFDSDKLSGLTEFIDPATREMWFKFDSLPIVEMIVELPLSYPYVLPSPIGGLASGQTPGIPYIVKVDTYWSIVPKQLGQNEETIVRVEQSGTFYGPLYSAKIRPGIWYSGFYPPSVDLFHADGTSAGIGTNPSSGTYLVSGPINGSEYGPPSEHAGQFVKFKVMSIVRQDGLAE